MAMFALCLAACGAPQPAADLDDLNLKLAQCRSEARVTKDGGATSADAFMKYEDCKRRLGVQK